MQLPAIQTWSCLVAFHCRPVGVTISRVGSSITCCICCKLVVHLVVQLVVVHLLLLASLVQMLPLASQVRLLPLVYLMQLLLLASLLLLLLPASVVELLLLCSGVCETTRLVRSCKP